MNKTFIKIAPVLAVALGSGAVWAEELVWIQADLVNELIATGYGDRSSTNVAYADGSPLFEDSFPQAYLEPGVGGNLLTAEVSVMHETPNSVTISAQSSVSWDQPPMIGSWANANAYLYAVFQLNSVPGDGASVDRDVIVTLEGDYESYKIDIDDGTAFVPLVEGTNAMTLDLDRPYTINAHLYNSVENVNNTQPGFRSAIAKLIVSIGDMQVSCHLAATPVYDQGMLTIDYEYSTPVDAVLYSWGTVGNRHEVLVDEDIVAGDSSTLNFSVGVEGLGVIGVGATLSAPGQGVICSDWKTVDTGSL